MKTILNILLAAAAVVLTWMCYESIQIPVQFNDECAKRDEVVIQRLKDIRTIQEHHRDKYQVYCSSWAQLINFAKNDSLPVINKVGTLTDDQLKEGLTEKDAWKYLCDPKKYAKEIDKFKLSKATFSRDTMFVNVLEKDSSLMNRTDFKIDSIQFIPFAENPSDTIELNTGTVTTASGYEMALFEARMGFDKYLWDLNPQELANKIDDRKQMDKFPGMQVGDATQANNNAGNWE